ncbi:hypothetical protein IHV69_25385, partial [Escherichia coli]|nr:hypothetical protein [Escherichia coli]
SVHCCASHCRHTAASARDSSPKANAWRAAVVMRYSPRASILSANASAPASDKLTTVPLGACTAMDMSSPAPTMLSPIQRNDEA